MPAPDTAIRAKRKLTNRLIAAHDAERLRPHLVADMLLIAGDGALIQGADAVIAAFAAQFADPAFLAYERTTDTVDLAADARRAAETGRWVGRWTGGVEMSGLYLAAWREHRGQWLLERELYVTLKGGGPPTPPPPLLHRRRHEPVEKPRLVHGDHHPHRLQPRRGEGLAPQPGAAIVGSMQDVHVHPRGDRLGDQARIDRHRNRHLVPERLPRLGEALDILRHRRGRGPDQPKAGVIRRW